MTKSKLVHVHINATEFESESTFKNTGIKYIKNILKAVRFSKTNMYPYGSHTSWYSKVDLNKITTILGGEEKDGITMWPKKVSSTKIKKVWELINSHK